MQYYTQTKPEILRTTLLYVVVVLLIGVVERIGVIRPLQQFFSTAMTPFSSYSSNLVFHTNSVLNNMGNYWSATEQLARVQKETAILQAELVQVQSLKKENDELKALLTSRQSSTTDSIRNTGTIINYASPTVVAHNNQPITVGQLVLAQDMLLGLVSESFGTQGRIELLSSLQTQPLLVKTEKGVEGTLVGNNKRIIMTDIARDVTVTSGERISTMGQEGIPRDIFVGTVSEEVDEPTAPVLSFIIVQPFSFFDTTVVELE